MYVEFDLVREGDNTDSAFRQLRVSMFRLQWDRWTERERIWNYQFSCHDGRARIQFDNDSTLSMFVLKWPHNNYRIVQ